MANKIHKKHGRPKGPPRRALRNAAPPRPARPATSPGLRREVEASYGKDARSTLDTLQTAAGAAGAALLCAYIAREDWLPPKMITGIVTAVGASCALVSKSDMIRSVGSGVMSAAGAQLGLMAIDDHYNGKVHPPQVAQAPGRKPANSDGLPPGALEAAYERARQRLALASSGDHLAA